MTTDPRGERRVQLGGRRRVIRYDYNALCDLEIALGVEGARGVGEKLAELGFRTLRAFTWAGLLHEEPDLDLREVGNWIGTDLGRMKDLGAAIGEAFAAAFPDAHDKGAKEESDHAGGDVEPGPDPTVAAGSSSTSAPQSSPA